MNYAELIEGIGFHDHLCMIYEDHEEQFGMILPFVKSGLLRKEKCVYIADDNTVEKVISEMKAADPDLFGKSLDNESLSVLTKRETYVKDGYFAPEKMIALLAENTDSALKAGFAGLRATGEMTWMFAGDPGSEKMMEYEAKLNDFLPAHQALAVCQYSRTKFSNEQLISVFQTHPKVIYRSEIIVNPLYLSTGDSQGLEKRMLEIIGA